MAQHWRPGENFFDRIKKAQILNILGGFDPECPALRGARRRTGDGCRACARDTIIEPKSRPARLGARCDALRSCAIRSITFEMRWAEDLPSIRANRTMTPAQPSGRPSTSNSHRTDPPSAPERRRRAARARLGSGGDHPMKPRHDIYATVTAQLVAAIESGAGEWRMPWHHSGAPVMRPTSVAGRRYSGINRLVLWATADACGYASGIWATYQQWRRHGGQVRKGAIGTHVILWKKVERGDAAAEAGGEGDSRARFFARSFVVFNRDQVDGADTPRRRSRPSALPPTRWPSSKGLASRSNMAARCLLPA
jgi:hypothetical protein